MRTWSCTCLHTQMLSIGVLSNPMGSDWQSPEVQGIRSCPSGRYLRDADFRSYCRSSPLGATLFFPCFAGTGRLGEGEEHDLLAGDGADVMVQAQHLDAGDVLDHRLAQRPRRRDQLNAVPRAQSAGVLPGMNPLDAVQEGPHNIIGGRASEPPASELPSGKPQRLRTSPKRPHQSTWIARFTIVVIVTLLASRERSRIL